MTTAAVKQGSMQSRIEELRWSDIDQSLWDCDSQRLRRLEPGGSRPLRQ